MNRLVTMATLAGALIALSGCVAEEGYYDQGYGYQGRPQVYRGGPNYYAPAPFWGPAYRGGGYRGDGYGGDGHRGGDRPGPAFRQEMPSRGAERGGPSFDPGRNARAQPQQQQQRAAPQGGAGGGQTGAREPNRVEQGAD